MAGDIRASLSYVWAKESDPKETYEFEFAGEKQWSCVRHSSLGAKSFRLAFDDSACLLWWGQSYFLDPAELNSKPDRAHWYRASDSAKPKRRAAFVWLRREPRASKGKNPNNQLTKSATKVFSEQLTKSGQGPSKSEVSRASSVQGHGAEKIVASSRPSLVVDRELVPKKHVAPVCNLPEVILDIDQILVIYKPPHWRCELPAKDEHAEGRLNKGPLILLRWIREKITSIDEKLFKEEFNPALSGTGFGPLSHRIDQETSGPLLVAKTHGAQRHLKAQFHKTMVKKRYICLVHGKFERQSGSIDARIRTLRTDQTTRSEISSSGDWAQTDYQVIATYTSVDRSRAVEGFNGYSLVACDIKTGRTHQIRVHMLHLGHPLVSDDKYLPEDVLIDDRAWCPRLFLHCYHLGFKNMKNSHELAVCPLPADLKSALVSLGAAEISTTASDLLFGETSWQRDLFRPPVLQWRPGTRILRRIATLLGSAAELVPLGNVHADQELQTLLAEEGTASIDRAWLSRHYDIFELASHPDGGEVSVRLRPQHVFGEVGLESDLERQIEAVQSELEELERQKQRAVAEEDYARAGEVKRRIEASRAEIASLQSLREESSSSACITYADERAQAAKLAAMQRDPAPTFTQDVRSEELFPSLVARTAAKQGLRKLASTTAESQAGMGPSGSIEGAPQEEVVSAAGIAPSETLVAGSDRVLRLKDVLIGFLERREGCVAHINEVNNDKFIREVMAAQQPKPVVAVNKTWLKLHEDTFDLLRTADNEIYIALCQAVRAMSKHSAGKAGGDTGLKVANVGHEQPRMPAYHHVIQKTSGEGDPKPLVYHYSKVVRSDVVQTDQDNLDTLTWQEQFTAALQRIPQKCCSAEELLAAVPFFADAMGAKRAREQIELLVMFLETCPSYFRVEKRGGGADKQYIIRAT